MRTAISPALRRNPYLSRDMCAGEEIAAYHWMRGSTHRYGRVKKPVDPGNQAYMAGWNSTEPAGTRDKDAECKAA